MHLVAQNDYREVIRRIFPTCCAIHCASITGTEASPYAEEHAVVSGALPSRRAEFFCGRNAARSALALLGHAPIAIRTGLAREPVWPTGIAGSISHSAGIVVAVVAPQSAVQAIGVDVESRNSVTRDLWSSVFVDEEIRFLRSQRNASTLATVMFSAKEAFYKAQYAITGEFLDFRQVKVFVDASSCTLQLTIPKHSISSLGNTWEWSRHFAVTASHVITGFTIVQASKASYQAMHLAAVLSPAEWEDRAASEAT